MADRPDSATSSELPPGPPAALNLLSVIWPQLATCAVLLIFGALSIWLLSALRAYVAGESFWSRAQKRR